MQKKLKKSNTEKSLSDYEISLIKALLKLEITNQDIQMYIAHYRQGNSINAAHIAEIKNGTRGAKIPPASKEEAERIIVQYKNSIQEDRELDEILKVDENNLLIAQESERFEFKQSFIDDSQDKKEKGYRNEKVLNFIQGAANNKGGYILFGIEEDKQHNTRKIIGLRDEEVKAFCCDDQEITSKFNSQFAQEIRFEKHTRKIGNRTICILKILESEDKPVMNKNKDIYYRYSGATEKIFKSDLQRVLKEQMARDMNLMLSKHIDQIFKNGVENTAILNIQTGEVEGKSGNFLIDEKLLPKIAFIKEGEFVEKNGAPALVLKGEVKTYETWVKEKEVQGIDDNDIYKCFFQNQNFTQDQSKAYLRIIATASPDWMPIRFFAQKAGMNKGEIIEYFNSLKDSSTKKKTIEGKIKKLNENQPMMEKKREVKCEILKQVEQSDLRSTKPEMRKWLTSIQSYDDQTIRDEKEFLLRFIQKLYEHCKKEDHLLLSQARKTIAYLDKVLYPLD